MLHRFVLLPSTTISAAVATFQEREATATARSSTTAYTTYAGNDREEDEATDDNSSYYWPPGVVSFAHKDWRGQRTCNMLLPYTCPS